MIKAISYIDSRNIYHSIEDLKLDPLGFNYKGLAEHLATNGGQYLKNVTTKLYGARFPAKLDVARHNRDDAFYRHIESTGIKVYYGHFKVNGGRAIEKGVDVRLATDLIVDGFYQNYTHAYVFSSDTDLIPAIEASVKRSGVKILVCLNNDKRHLKDEFTKVGAQVLFLGKALMAQFATNTAVKPTTASLNDLVIKKDFNKFSKK
jgi:uncharacterized LabA/DUF88 family protein